MHSRIHYTKPSITELEIRYAQDAVAHGWGEQCYAYIGRFEQAFAQHLGASHALATSSCTGALHMGLKALDIGVGHEVILGDINWVASAAPITYLGATPVLVDVLADSWTLDPEAVERAITPATRAIVAVHLYGNLCAMDALLEIGEKHGIPVIEDAAEAIGSSLRGRAAGTMGCFGVFSFHGTKTMTTGEGGMLVTQDDALFERITTLSNHGRARGQKRQFWPDEIGFKYKMSNVQAAIGLGQVERIGELVAAKRRIFARYQAGLAGLPLHMNPEPEHTVNGYWMPTIVVNEQMRFDRDALLQRFQAHNIDGRVFFWPLSDTGHFALRTPTPVAHAVSPRAINLPSYHDLRDEEIDRVCAVVRASLQ